MVASPNNPSPWAWLRTHRICEIFGDEWAVTPSFSSSPIRKTTSSSAWQPRLSVDERVFG